MSQETDQRRRELRDYVIEQRNALSDAQLRSAAHDMTLLLESTPEFHHAVHIAAYWPVKGEMDVLPLIEQARRYNKHVYLPVMVGSTLKFAPYQPDMPMRHIRLGYAEAVVAHGHVRLVGGELEC